MVNEKQHRAWQDMGREALHSATSKSKLRWVIISFDEETQDMCVDYNLSDEAAVAVLKLALLRRGITDLLAPDIPPNGNG